MTRAKTRPRRNLPQNIHAVFKTDAPTTAALETWLAKHKGAMEQLAYHWLFWRRPDQCPPEGDWRCWLILAGRRGAPD